MRRILLWPLLLPALVGACADVAGPAPVPSNKPVVLPAPLPPLPPPVAAKTDRFDTNTACAQCHRAADGSSAMKDAAGRDASPSTLWETSMMALAARDPFYLAVFSQELKQHDGATELIEQTCTRCHAPAASVEHQHNGGHVTFEDMVANDSPLARLGRDGVTCSLCHQIEAAGLGTPSSFTGGFGVGFDRQIFGPHQGPKTGPMQFFVSYTPVQADHITSSALCASCHTVIVNPLDRHGNATGGKVIEQASYLEWCNSDYNDENGGALAAPCVHCHMPSSDEDGQAIVTRIARVKDVLSERQPFGRHTLVGGNAYMLRMLADNETWANSGLPAEAMERAAKRVEKHLAEAVALSVESAERVGGSLKVDIRLNNLTGHKFPTGYPTRRAWVHLRVMAGSELVFESGAYDSDGALLAHNKRLDPSGVVLPHRDTIDAADQVALYESILVDDKGQPTHLALAADHYVKDNRIQPLGWSSASAKANGIQSVATASDSDFVPGSDGVHYTIADVPNSALTIEIEMLYQSIVPASIDAFANVPTAAAVRFYGMTRKRAPTPISIAAATVEVP